MPHVVPHVQACKASRRSCLQGCHPGHSCVNGASECESNEVLDLTTQSVPPTPHSSTQNSKHSSILESNSWLDDEIVKATQALLKGTYPAVEGLQPPSLGEQFGIEPQPFEFVQVLNDHGNHWITVSTIGCEASSINVFDSLHGKLSPHTERLVADILQSQDRAIRVNYIDVQWQSGVNDCGLFALAFATSLCAGQDPATISYDQRQMRAHLLSCLGSDEIRPFPTRGARRAVRKPRDLDQLIPVFCVCRLTDTGTQMVQCSSCDEWYHTGCISIESKYIESTDLQWRCPSCK